MWNPHKAKDDSQFLAQRLLRVRGEHGPRARSARVGQRDPGRLQEANRGRLGVNVEQEFDPLYVVPGSKKKVVSQPKICLRNADELILATDEDREGESIGWHLYEVPASKVPVQRMITRCEIARPSRRR
ncbi:MAG: toprim domain-containing protein [Caldilineaceae bacterium]